MPRIPKENRLNVEMKDAFNQYRALRLKRLAERVRKIVGADGDAVLSTQLYKHTDELRAKLMGPVYTYTTSYERKDVYHMKANHSSGVPAGVKLAVFVLKLTGCKRTMKPDGNVVYRYASGLR
jgi:hypothetical protein